MKKGTKILLAIGIILLAVGATMVNIAHGRGERPGAGFKAGFELFGGGLQSGYTLCESGEVSFDPAEVKSLDVDWSSGSVTVLPYDGDELLVSEYASSRLSESQRLRWRLSGGRLSILCCAQNRLQLADKDLSVFVPEGWIAESVELDGASADISLSQLSVRGDLRVDTGSGDVFLMDLRADRVEVDGASAWIYLSALACGELDLDTASGGIMAEELVCGGVSADSASGDVYLDFAEAPRAVEADTASGDVTLVFPDGTGIALDFDPGSGKLYGEFQSGRLPVEVDTGSGDLIIGYR